MADLEFLGQVWKPWSVLESWVDPSTRYLHVHVAVSPLRLRGARDPSDVARQLAPGPIPRRVYVGPYAPRAAMRRRAGL